jgi:hypothetical protein
MRMITTKSSPFKGEQGFVLVIVLGVCVVLALLGAGFAASIRGDLRTTASAVNAGQAESIADAGIALAQLDMRDAPKNGPTRRRFPIDGTAVGCTFDDAGSLLIVQVEDEGGKVNLNTPNGRLLEAFFAGLGATPEQALAFSQSRAAAPVATIEGLDQIPGLPGEILSRAKGLATVQSTSVGIDPLLSSPDLIAVLKAGAEKLSESGSFEPPDRGASDDLAPEFISRSANTAFTIRSLGQLANGTRVITEAIVQTAGPQSAQVTLRQWRRGVLRTPQDQLLMAVAAGRPC